MLRDNKLGIRTKGLPWWLRQERICLQCRRPRFDLWVGKTPWRRKWQPTPVFLPGEFQGQSSLVGYSPWGRRVGHDWATNTHTLDQKDHWSSEIYLSLFIVISLFSYFYLLLWDYPHRLSTYDIQIQAFCFDRVHLLLIGFIFLFQSLLYFCKPLLQW